MMEFKVSRGITGLLVMGMLWLGCDGGSNEFVPSNLEEGGSSATGETVEGTTGEGEASQESTEAGQAVPGDVAEENSGFPDMSAFSNGCSDEEDTCGAGFTCASAGGIGACVVTPEENTSLSDPFSQEKDETVQPDFSCVNQYPPVEASSETTLYGVVDRFGAGPVTDNILIRVFRADDFNPWVCDALELEERTACLYELVENQELAVAETIAEAAEEQTGLECSTDQDCPRDYSCTGDLDGECFLNFGSYELEGIPTNIPLVVMTRPADAEDGGDWHNTYMYDVVIVEDYVEESRYRFDPLIVGHGQWKVVPNPFFTTIKVGNGAVGGRIRDCGVTGQAGRRGWNLGEATVGFATPPAKIGYFNDKEEESLPDPDRSSTNILGRYTGLDVPPGPNVVSAAVTIDGEVLSLGATPFYVFPNSLAIVSLPGRVATFTQE